MLHFTIMEWYLLSGTYVVLCKLYLIFGLRSERKYLKALLKAAPVALLLCLAGRALSANVAPVSASAPGSAKKLYCLFWGLILSALGDVYLVFPQHFLLGLVSFAIAQSIYVAMFGGGLSLLADSSRDERAVGVALCVVSVSIYLYLLPKLKGLLVVLAIVYDSLITLMLWSAVVQMMRAPSDMTVLGAVGAALFYSSDFMLGINNWRVKLPFAQLLIMTTYYSAQFFIFVSVTGSIA